LRSDASRGALLLERLGRPMSELRLPLRRRHEILCDLANRIWRAAPDRGLQTGAVNGRWLCEFIVAMWEALDRPIPERTVAHALACAERRIAAHNDARAVLVRRHPSMERLAARRGIRAHRPRTASWQSRSTT
jgi:streptomycin 6-kinase